MHRISGQHPQPETSRVGESDILTPVQSFTAQLIRVCSERNSQSALMKLRKRCDVGNDI
jgi:hypothetical protein